jgi:hypothetical protein
MRYLKQSTVVKAFIKRGWVWSNNGGQCPDYLLYNGSGGTRLFGNIEHGRVKIHDGRFRYYPNVHIVSYWGPFRSVKELEEKLDAIETVYSELCGTYFPRRYS